jgi:hypothetical protein
VGAGLRRHAGGLRKFWAVGGAGISTVSAQELQKRGRRDGYFAARRMKLRFSMKHTDRSGGRIVFVPSSKHFDSRSLRREGQGSLVRVRSESAKAWTPG